MFTSSFSVTQKKVFMFIALLLNVCNAKVFGIGSSKAKYTVKKLGCLNDVKDQDILKDMEVIGYAGISNLKDNLEMLLKCKYSKSRNYLVNLAFQRRKTSGTYNPAKWLNTVMKSLKLKSVGEFHITIIKEEGKENYYESGNKNGFTSPRTGKEIIPNKEFYDRLFPILEANKPINKDRKGNKITVFDIVREFRGHKYSHTAGSALKYNKVLKHQGRLDNRRTMMRKVHQYLQGDYDRKANNSRKNLLNFAFDAAYGAVSMLPLIPQIGVMRTSHEARLGMKLEDWIVGDDKDLEEYLRATKKARDDIKAAEDKWNKVLETRKAESKTQRRLIALERLL